MKNVIVFLSIFCFSLSSGFSQEKGVRFAIASFEVDGEGNADLKRRLRSEFENQLFDVADQCLEQMEFLPDVQEEAIEYTYSINERYKVQYGVQSERLRIPKKGNYILLVRIEPDNNGTYMQIGVFEKGDRSLSYVGNGVAESQEAINTLYASENRKAFISRAVSDVFSSQRISSWIEKQTNGRGSLENCEGDFSQIGKSSPSRTGNGSGLNKNLQVEEIEDADCQKANNGRGYSTACFYNQSKEAIKIRFGRPGYAGASTIIIHPNQTECVYGVASTVMGLNVWRNLQEISTRKSEYRTIKMDKCKAKTITIR